MKRTAWIPFVPAVLLIAGNGVAAAGAAAVLDVFIVRPGPAAEGSGSITTLLPGLAYACATVMKVCLIAGAASIVVQICKWLITRGQGRVKPAAAGQIPCCAIASIALTPLATVAGAMAAVAVQRMALTHAPLSAAQFQHAAQAAVHVMLAVLSAGAVSAALSWIRREGSPWMPALGLLVNAILIGLFLYLRFHAPGFDQDTWTPRAF